MLISILASTQFCDIIKAKQKVLYIFFNSALFFFQIMLLVLFKKGIFAHIDKYLFERNTNANTLFVLLAVSIRVVTFFRRVPVI